VDPLAEGNTSEEEEENFSIFIAARTLGGRQAEE